MNEDDEEIDEDIEENYDSIIDLDAVVIHKRSTKDSHQSSIKRRRDQSKSHNISVSAILDQEDKTIEFDEEFEQYPRFDTQVRMPFSPI